MSRGDREGVAGGVEARLAKAERLLEAVGLTQRDVMDRLDVQQEKLDAVLGAMESVAREMREQTALLRLMAEASGHA